MQYDGRSMYAFVGAKSSIVVDRRDGRDKAVLAALAGAGVDVTPTLRLEVNGGTFDRGYNELADVSSTKVRLYGASVQASIHRGAPVQSSDDYQLYRYNGESITGLFAPERYPGGVAWLAQSEFTILGQRLKDPTMSGATTVQYGMAGDLNVRVKIDRLRLRLDLSYRDLAFILRAQTGNPDSFAAFQPDSTTSPDTFAAVGADRNWGDWLTLGFILGVDKPATLRAPQAMDPEGTTQVIRDNNVDQVFTTLPPGAKGVAQYAAKGTARVDFAKVFSALLEVFYSHDRNQTHRTCIDVDQCQFEFGPPNQLGLNATLQARF